MIVFLSAQVAYQYIHVHVLCSPQTKLKAYWKGIPWVHIKGFGPTPNPTLKKTEHQKDMGPISLKYACTMYMQLLWQHIIPDWVLKLLGLVVKVNYSICVPIDNLSSDGAPGMAQVGASQRPSSVWGHVGRSLLLPVHAKDDRRSELRYEIC
jgi:hypothetical protein